MRTDVGRAALALALGLVPLSLAAGTPQADLRVAITDGRTRALPGETLTYDIEVFNAGPDPASLSSVTTELVPSFVPGRLDLHRLLGCPVCRSFGKRRHRHHRGPARGRPRDLHADRHRGSRRDRAPADACHLVPARGHRRSTASRQQPGRHRQPDARRAGARPRLRRDAGAHGAAGLLLDHPAAVRVLRGRGGRDLGRHRGHERSVARADGERLDARRCSRPCRSGPGLPAACAGAAP